MRLSATERKKQLIEIAMRLFSEQGFDGTSTREIAEAAGINEAIIFRHFKTKEDLYWAVLSDRIERRGRNRRVRELLESRRDTREILVAVAETMLDRTEDDTAVTRLLFYSALRNRELSERFFETYANEKFELLARFIGDRIQSREFHATNPLIASRSFLGMVIYHYLIREVFGVHGYGEFSARELAEEVTDIFLGGIKVNKHSRTNVERVTSPRAMMAVSAK